MTSTPLNSRLRLVTAGTLAGFPIFRIPAGSDFRAWQHPPSHRMTSPRLSTGQRLGDFAWALGFAAFFAVIVSHG